MAIATTRRIRSRLALTVAAGALVAASVTLGSQGRKFYDDDPIAREPETQDASKVQAWANVLTYDLVLNSFATPGSRDRVRAGNVNTIDEVPDSSWFTNRILAREISREEAIHGPVTQPGPTPGPWTVHRAKPEGVSPGFRVLDAAGVEWFIQFDARGYPAAASGASIVANRIFHALGYFQVEQHIAELDRETLTIGPQATTETPSGKIRRLDRDDLDKLFAKTARQPNGKYRVLAGRRLPGRIVGGFRYAGTRPDDPNDIVPHEHRRELRALKVFGAWTNLVDMKAGNTLDTVISENGRARVRHYLQDTGSTFGTGALGPHQWDEGYEYYYEADPAWKRLVSFGLYRRPWQTVPYENHREVGPFEGDEFDPTAWRPRTPTGAFLNARADDNFWAARRVMAFSDDLIRAVVTVAQYRDPASERYLADVLIKRRDAIARTYLNAVNPVINVALGVDGTLTFANAAVDARVATEPSDGYRAEWAVFDNTTRETRSLGAPTTTPTGRMIAPSALPANAGAFVYLRISATDPRHPSWAIPADAYFRRTATGWRLTGFERLPER